MNIQPKVSVIFPIFNNEKYLKKCIQSVVDSSLKEIEIILIDDGSTDNAPNIIDEFVKSDNRIKAVHKKNEGSAAGRNDGIDMATGEYIAFVESDDCVEPNIYEILYGRAKEVDADIVKCGFNYIVNGKKDFEYIGMYSVACEDEVFDIKKYPKLFHYHASIWAGIYKKSFLDAYNIRFLETPKATYSDFSFMTMTYAYAKKINIVRKALYNYTFDNAASSHMFSGSRFKYKMYHAEESIKILKNADIYKYVKEDFAVEMFKNTADVAISVPVEDRETIFRDLQHLFKELVDESFRYREFSSYGANIIQAILKGDKNKFYDYLLKEFLVLEPQKYCDKKIVLYGAGRCGKCIEHQLKDNANIVLWVDKAKSTGIPEVVSPEKVLVCEYDYVLVGVYKMSLFLEIKRELIDLGIPENKIVWETAVFMKTFIND